MPALVLARERVSVHTRAWVPGQALPLAWAAASVTSFVAECALWLWFGYRWGRLGIRPCLSSSAFDVKLTSATWTL